MTLSVESFRTDTPPDLHVAAWVAAVALFGVGDVALTLYGLSALGVAEANPVALGYIETFGLLSLVVVKAGAFALFWTVYHYGPRLYRTGIPVGLAVLGAVVVGWNIGVLVVAGGWF